LKSKYRTSGSGRYGSSCCYGLSAGGSAMQNEIMQAQLNRIEQKLDLLLEALAAEGRDDEPPALTLEGDFAGAPRPQGKPL